MVATVAWISSSPIKGLQLQHHERVEVTEKGIPGDRGYFLVDERDRMVSATRLGALLGVRGELSEAERELRLAFGDGGELVGPVELGRPEGVHLRGVRLEARPVLGAFSEALSVHVGQPLRLVKAPPARSGLDRGGVGALTLLSVASVERLREQAGVTEAIDPRRFRMNIGIEGAEPHAEDGWLNREIELGETRIEILGHVGRCAVTTRDPDTGETDMDTLGHLAAYRDEVDGTERLPFGVHARVVRPGAVGLGDPVQPVDAPAPA